jgi:serine/threonine-protein kinase
MAHEDPAALSGSDYKLADDPVAEPAPVNEETGLVGRELGTYRLVRPLGGAGMCKVYLAEQTAGDHKQFAVKVLRNANFNQAALDVVQKRFVHEARVASRLHHPHIVDVVDFGISDGLAYVVTEYLDGESLRETLARHGPLPWTRVLPMFLHICDALEAAHARGTLHRDLKPSNCFRVRHATGDDYIKVCDFGLARIVDEDLPEGLLAGGVLLSTPEYMAPELIRGVKPDARVDIYGVGVLLYELLTGTCPFKSGKQTTVLAMQLLDTAIPPRRVAPDANIPSSVERVIMRALSKQPEDRFQSIADMRAALLDDTRLLKTPAPAGGRRPTSSLSRSMEASAVQQRGGVGMTVVLALIAAGLVAWVLAGTPGIGGAAPPAPAPPVVAPAPTKTPPPAPVKTTPPAPEPAPAPMTATPEPAPEPTPTPTRTAAGDAKKPARDRPAGTGGAKEPVNYDIVDDPSAPTEVSEAQIDGLLRPLRPSASECGKTHGLPVGGQIGVKMLLASDGRLTNVRPTDRPAGDPAFQCVAGLLRGVKLDVPAGQKGFTSAFFDYTFSVY